MRVACTLIALIFAFEAVVVNNVATGEQHGEADSGTVHKHANMSEFAAHENDPPCCAQCADLFKSCAIFHILNLCQFEGWIQTGCNRSCERCTLPSDCICAPPEIPPVFEILLSHSYRKKSKKAKAESGEEDDDAEGGGTTEKPSRTVGYAGEEDYRKLATKLAQLVTEQMRATTPPTATEEEVEEEEEEAMQTTAEPETATTVATQSGGSQAANETPRSSGEGLDHPKCMDEFVFCRHWADAGECTGNPGWMPRHCKASCGKC